MHKTRYDKIKLSGNSSSKAGVAANRVTDRVRPRWGEVAERPVLSATLRN